MVVHELCVCMMFLYSGACPKVLFAWHMDFYPGACAVL